MDTILGLLQAVSAIESLKPDFDKFVAWYVARRISEMRAEDASSLMKAVQEYDQRPIEHALGSPLEGQLSGDAGTTVVDDVPGVPK